MKTVDALLKIENDAASISALVSYLRVQESNRDAAQESIETARQRAHDLLAQIENVAYQMKQGVRS